MTYAAACQWKGNLLTIEVAVLCHPNLSHAEQVPADRSGIHIFKVDPLLPAANVLQVGAKSL